MNVILISLWLSGCACGFGIGALVSRYVGSAPKHVAPSMFVLAAAFLFFVYSISLNDYRSHGAPSTPIGRL